MGLLDRLFRRSRFTADTPAAPSTNSGPQEAKAVDPLDPIQKMRGWDMPQGVREYRLRSARDFPIWDGYTDEALPLARTAMDAAVRKLVSSGAVMDDCDDTGQLKLSNEYTVPFALNAWYMSQGFIGYQACAIIAQHWLVDKACSMAGEDATRNGWAIKARGGEDLDDEALEQILAKDKKLRIKENLIELNRFKNVFGIRIAIFKVKSDDKDYYEKPFNIDGVTADSYEGISQVDPYWMTPVLTNKSTSDPASITFYEPEFWQINGVKYHRSHLIIVRGPQPADILKPTYIFGGVPLTQRIYERVYAAERTANEAPLLSMSKRTTAIHVDVEKVLADQASFEARLARWIAYRDNHAVKVLGTEESMEQFDVSLSDFDSVIMNQYQIVAAIARVPSTKLLGTSPKGFNATGEFEMHSYHEELESIQEHTMMPLLERHYDILCKSLSLAAEVEVVCNPVDSITTQQRAELNSQKATTGETLINAGVISPEEERQRIKDYEHSGYNRLSDEVQAETDPGASPENLNDKEKAENTGKEGEGAFGHKDDEAEEDTDGHGAPALAALVSSLLAAVSKPPGGSQPSPEALKALLLMLAGTVATGPKEGADIPTLQPPIRGTHPKVVGVQPSVGGVHHVVEQVDTFDWAPKRLPKMKLNGLTLAIENPRGSVRRGEDADGNRWSVRMPHHYGFIKGYPGADGDEMDVMIGPNLRATDIWVINQKDPSTDEFDEHKCMIGFDTQAQAIEAYKSAYSRDEHGFDGIVHMDVAEFKDWLANGDCNSPAM